MTRDVLLTLNPGSSTIKIGLFALEGGRAHPCGTDAIDLPHPAPPAARQIDEALAWVREQAPKGRLVGVGHRVVHGGDRFAGPVRVTDETLAAIEALAPLAPLHQPQSLRLMHALREIAPQLPQVASFDTAFHRTQSDLVRRFALPRALFDEGVKRYGFHGLSYQFIAGQMQRNHPDLAAGRVVVAHLGSGASLCGLVGGQSRDTSMSFSTLDGIPMATRPGALDPGVLLHLLKARGMRLDAVEDMLYHRAGLLGISGISADTRELAESTAPEAREALALFALRIAREVAAMATTLGGLDAVVFTAGIGEHQPAVRAAVCAHLGWIGLALDAGANTAHAPRIDAAGSQVAVLVMHTNEEQVIADEACHVLSPISPESSP